MDVILFFILWIAIGGCVAYVVGRSEKVCKDNQKIPK